MSRLRAQRPPGVSADQADHRRSPSLDGLAGHVPGDDGRMDVGAAAHRPRVAELARDGVDGGDDPVPGIRLGLESTGLVQRARREQGAGPRAEVLGGEVAVARLAYVLVHVVGRDRVALALGVEVLEEVLAGQVFATLDHTRHAPVFEADRNLDAALALEQKPHGRAAHVDVPVAQRGQAERVILPGVLLVADAQERGLEQADDGTDHLLLRQPFPAQVGRRAPADPRQRPGELGHAVELVRVASLAPPCVVEVLLAAACVTAGRLEVAPGTRRDPHVLPRRRDGKGADPVERAHVADGPAGLPEVLEVLAPAHAADSRLVVGGVDKPRLGRRVYAALGGVIPGPPHSGCIAVRRLRLRAHSRAMSSSRVVSSPQGNPSWHRLALTSSGSSSSARCGRAILDSTSPSWASVVSWSLMYRRNALATRVTGQRKPPRAFRRTPAPPAPARRASARPRPGSGSAPCPAEPPGRRSRSRRRLCPASPPPSFPPAPRRRSSPARSDGRRAGCRSPPLSSESERTACSRPGAHAIPWRRAKAPAPSGSRPRSAARPSSRRGTGVSAGGAWRPAPCAPTRSRRSRRRAPCPACP